MTWHGPRMAVTLAALCLFAFGAAPAFAQLTDVTSSAPITIAPGGAANPYPSTVSVSGMSGTVDDVTLTMHGLDLGSTGVDVVLQSPHGESLMVLSDAGTVSNATFVFTDAAANAMPSSGADTTGATPYKPTNFSGSDEDLMGSPAPLDWGGSFAGLNGQDANGTWKLFVYDGNMQEAGSLDSWQLQVHTNAPQFSVAPTSRDFGTVTASRLSSSGSQTFTISNLDSPTMNVTSVQLQGPDAADFTLNPGTCASAALGAEETCTLSASFTPREATAPGAKSAAIVVDSNAGGHPHSIPLTGNALAPTISFSPASIDFGTYKGELHKFAATQGVTVTNTGTAPLAVGAPTSLGGEATHFTQAENCGTLAPGASCTLLVSFVPQTYGTHSSFLVIDDNASGTPHSIALTGTAVPGDPAPQNPGVKESGSPDIDVKSVSFSTPPVAGFTTNLDVTASNPKEPVTGLIVDFGEKLGVFAESACVVGVTKGNETTFRIPYSFLTPGSHTVKVTVFSGGCGKPESHTYEFTVNVAAPIAARRIARMAATLVGPDITSKCKDSALAPTLKNGKRIVKALLCVMNEQRKLAKLKPLKISKKLTRAALAHSRAMVSGGFFSHQGPKEAALVSRLKKVKYRGAGAENIGAGGGSLGSPVAMVNGWMHSPLHKANLLSRKWKTVGIGFLPKFPVPGASAPSATYTTDFGVRK